MQRIIFISLFFFSFTALSETSNTNEPAKLTSDVTPYYFFLETLYEKNGEATIYGIQGGLLNEDAFNSINVYVGLGVISVDLLQQNYKFSSLRGFLGISPDWKIAPYAEFGIDLLEEIFNVCNGSNDDYCSTDPSFSLGIRWRLSKQLMLNAYHKWYTFDGAILNQTDVNLSGISIGLNF